MKRLITFIILIFVSFFVYSQDKKENHWESILVKNTCSFDLPPNMEIREKGTLVDEAAKYMSNIYDYTYSSDHITLQPKGANKNIPTAFSIYGRIIIETTRGDKGDFPLIETLTKEDVKYMKQLLTDKIESQKTEAKQYGISIKEISPVSIKKINGKSAFFLTYKRESTTKGKPDVYVDKYLILNNDKAIDITLSYRSSEESIWKLNFDIFIRSFVCL